MGSPRFLATSRAALIAAVVANTACSSKTHPGVGAGRQGPDAASALSDGGAGDAAEDGAAGADGADPGDAAGPGDADAAQASDATPRSDAGAADAGARDAAGASDAGRPDAQAADSGMADAGHAPDAGTPDAGPVDGGTVVEVLQHHGDARRSGVYVVPEITRQAAAHLHRDTTFDAPLTGPTYTQPLYFSNASGGRDLLIVATERDQVIAFDAANAQVVWQRTVGTPIPLTSLPCGNIDPVGITGTPIIDRASRTVFFDSMLASATAPAIRHVVHALSVDDGTPRSGWPVDLSALIGPGALAFDPHIQNQRGALALVGGVLYVPFGGHFFDCGNYHGWVVGVPLATPAAPRAWATRAPKGGIWSPAGLTADGTNLYVSTGNTDTNGTTYGDGESVIRLQPGPSYSGATTDFFAPSDWSTLDANDQDLTGTVPLFVDVPGAIPSAMLLSLGKNGVAYLINRTNMGGIGAAVASAQVTAGVPLSSAVVYSTSQGTYFAFQAPCPGPTTGDLVAYRVTATSPPAIDLAWCAQMGSSGRYSGSPIVTMTDPQGGDAIVWTVAAEGDGTVRGFNADTGSVVFAGGSTADRASSIQHFQVPIAVGGRLFVAGNDRLWAFTVHP